MMDLKNHTERLYSSLNVQQCTTTQVIYLGSQVQVLLQCTNGV